MWPADIAWDAGRRLTRARPQRMPDSPAATPLHFSADGRWGSAEPRADLLERAALGPWVSLPLRAPPGAKQSPCSTGLNKWRLARHVFRPCGRSACRWA